MKATIISLTLLLVACENKEIEDDTATEEVETTEQNDSEDSDESDSSDDSNTNDTTNTPDDNYEEDDNTENNDEMINYTKQQVDEARYMGIYLPGAADIRRIDNINKGRAKAGMSPLRVGDYYKGNIYQPDY